eukprot:3142756-Pleurochrysis_carterae.AAC.1
MNYLVNANAPRVQVNCMATESSHVRQQAWNNCSQILPTTAPAIVIAGQQQPPSQAEFPPLRFYDGKSRSDHSQPSNASAHAIR